MSQQTSNRSFDELTRGLASGSISRGKALRLMGAALVGGTLASVVGIGEAGADDECKPLNKKCRQNHQCCSGNCANGTCAVCPEGWVLLENGTCARFCNLANPCPDLPCACFNSERLCGNVSTGIGLPGSCHTHMDCPVGTFCNTLVGRCFSPC